jgi:hypothetical protein
LKINRRERKGRCENQRYTTEPPSLTTKLDPDQKPSMSISRLHTKKHFLGRNPGALFILGALLFTLACGVLEKVPDTARNTQQAATQGAQHTEVAGINDYVKATMSVKRTAWAQELNIQLTKLSSELNVPQAEDGASSWITRWLSSPACQPPCWEKITPGVTTMEEAVKIVYQIPGVDITWLPSMTGVTEGEKSLQWYFNPSDFGSIEPESGQEIVSVIRLGAGGEQKLLLGEVIAAYGNPSAVVKGRCHFVTCVYSVVYKDRGMELDIGTYDNKKVDIQADTEISTIFLSPLNEPRLHAAGIQWSGYGQYDFNER